MGLQVDLRFETQQDGVYGRRGLLPLETIVVNP